MFSPLKTWHILLGDLLWNRRPSLLGSLNSRSCWGVAAPRCAAATCGFIEGKVCRSGNGLKTGGCDSDQVCLDLFGESITAFVPVNVVNDALPRECLLLKSNQPH